MNGRGFSPVTKRKALPSGSCLLILLLCSLMISLGGSSGIAQAQKGVSGYTVDKRTSKSDIAIGDLYAVVVGVSQYANPKISQLNYADNDARDFADFLKSQERLFRRLHVTLLLNDRATSAQVKKELVYGLKKAGKDDTVVLFLSGHGADDPQNPGEFFFVTHDADPDCLEASAVNLTEMKFMKRLDTKRAVLIADTCHAGGFSMHGAKAIEASFSRLVNQFRESEGKVILTSCKPDELSMEKAGLTNSVFTHYLLEGLRGSADSNGDGIVSLQEVYDFVYEKAKHETSGMQHPQFNGRISGLFPLSLARSYDSPSNRPPGHTQHQSQSIQLNEVASLVQSAEKGDADAQFLLGMIYRQGRLGLPRNQTEAIKWLEKAANGGHPEARAMLASIRGSGSASPPTVTSTYSATAAPASLSSADSYVQSLWRRASEGERFAQYMLAFKLEHGQGVQRNTVEAKKWYKAAAAQGDREASEALRRLEGRSSPPIVTSAYSAPVAPSALSYADSYVQSLWRRASEGERFAQYMLAFKLEHGQGVQRNTEEAKKWYKAAAAQGDREAVSALRRLGVRVSYPRQGDAFSATLERGSGGSNGVVQLINPHSSREFIHEMRH